MSTILMMMMMLSLTQSFFHALQRDARSSKQVGVRDVVRDRRGHVPWESRGKPRCFSVPKGVLRSSNEPHPGQVLAVPIQMWRTIMIREEAGRTQSGPGSRVGGADLRTTSPPAPTVPGLPAWRPDGDGRVPGRVSSLPEHSLVPYAVSALGRLRDL